MWNILIILLCNILVGLLVSAERENVEYGHDCKERCFPADIKDPLVCRSVATNISVCACSEGLFRHETLNRCVAPTGGVCTTRSSDGMPIATCTEFAVCWSEVMNDASLLRQNGTCHCEPDAKMDTQTGLCKLKYGATRCNKIGDCDITAGLNCQFSNCVCRDQTYQTYNRTSGQCEALVGGKCGVAVPPFPATVCVGPNMTCEKERCRCEEGYAKTIDRKCIQLTDMTYTYNENSPRPYPSFPYAASGGSGYKGGGQELNGVGGGGGAGKADKKNDDDDEAD